MFKTIVILIVLVALINFTLDETKVDIKNVISEYYELIKDYINIITDEGIHLSGNVNAVNGSMRAWKDLSEDRIKVNFQETEEILNMAVKDNLASRENDTTTNDNHEASEKNDFKDTYRRLSKKLFYTLSILENQEYEKEN